MDQASLLQSLADLQKLLDQLSGKANATTTPNR